MARRRPPSATRPWLVGRRPPTLSSHQIGIAADGVKLCTFGGGEKRRFASALNGRSFGSLDDGIDATISSGGHQFSESGSRPSVAVAQ